MFDWNMVTAVCAVLGLFGGFSMWFNNAVQSRKAGVKFNVKKLSADIYRITLFPQAIEYVYQIEDIQSDYPLYTRYKGLDVLGKGKIELYDELNKERICRTIHSNSQQIDSEPFIEFFVNLKGHTKSVYTIRLLFKSDRFPFRWGKPLAIPVG